MILTHLRIQNIRNHWQSELECPPGIILLWGENGAGKTTVLEAVSLLCTTRSFVTTADRTLLRRGEESMRADGVFHSDSGVRHTVGVQVAMRKKIELDNAPLEAAADLIGRFPVVTLSPQHRAITAGGPAERRSFMDFVVSQVSRQYLLDLIEYRRILRHRNALLSDHGHRVHALRAQLEAWDTTLSECAVRITRRRRAFVVEYDPYFRRAMSDVVEDRELPAFRYVQSAVVDMDAGDAAEQFRAALGHALERDAHRGVTSVGPHRDDLEITLNGMDVRAHASQGQHKTLLIALKAGEWFFLNDHLDERPMFLLDDVFSELDDTRLRRILAVIPRLGQTFITTANHAILDALPGLPDERALYRVSDGGVHAHAEAA
ncbi:MAG: DNA replication and repair protein RecF [Ignavibacteriae bacterium]|nr:DNA replication and repair protein RecF [Ignavibacteriota bacterium]